MNPYEFDAQPVMPRLPHAAMERPRLPGQGHGVRSPRKPGPKQVIAEQLAAAVLDRRSFGEDRDLFMSSLNPNADRDPFSSSVNPSVDRDLFSSSVNPSAKQALARMVNSRIQVWGLHYLPAIVHACCEVT